MNKRKLAVDKQKLIVICGPTATGKTELGIKLAKKFGGEIISADSRQVYKGMDIGTGKDIEEYKKENIKIWGLDLVEPDYQFNVGEYRKFAQEAINDIWQRGKLPIVVGGTGLYIKALLEPMDFTRIPPDKKLREVLTDKSIKVLQKELVKVDKDRLEKMNNSDRNNPRRLIRAIEIASYFKSHPFSVIARSEATKQSQRLPRPFGARNDNLNNKNILLIGLNAPQKIIFKKIAERIKKRLDQGMIKEIEKLLAKHYGWDLTSMSGLGYQEFKPYFEKKESLSEVVKKWQIDEQNYVKRQMVWFKKMPVIWFDISQPGFYTEIENRLCKFLLKP